MRWDIVEIYQRLEHMRRGREKDRKQKEKKRKRKREEAWEHRLSGRVIS